MLGWQRNPRIDELVIIDDFFRGSENGLPELWQNRKFLREFFGTAAARLGWKIREVCSKSQGGCISVTDIMKAYGLPQSPEGWAAACVIDLEVATEWLDCLDLPVSALVMGWGLPPAIMQYLDRRGITFIDVELDAIRFTRDLHLVMRTNDKGIQHEMERLRIGDEKFWSAAAGIRAHYARRGQSFIIRPDLSVGMFAGQMPIDLAVVKGGCLAKPADYVEEIAKWAQQVDLLAICPHPAQDDSSHLHVLMEHIPNAVLINRNSYSLLCAENLAFVGAISSGLLKEAEYLCHGDVKRLMVDDRNNRKNLPESCSPWIPVELAVASAETLMRFSRARQGFWKRPLSDIWGKRKYEFPEDMLNQIFGYRWGLNPAAEGLPKMPVLPLGGRMLFSMDEAGSICAIFGRGWNSPEYWGVWSSGSYASLMIPFELSGEEPPTAGLRFSLSGRAFVPENTVPPVITISVNGTECDIVSEHNWEIEWSVHLDEDSIRRRLLVVCVKVQGALRQCDLGGAANDLRSFGLGLRSVALDEAEPIGCVAA